MSNQEKRVLIKAALVAATRGITAEDVKAGRAQLRTATGLRAGVDGGYCEMFTKDAPTGPFPQACKPELKQ